MKPRLPLAVALGLAIGFPLLAASGGCRESPPPTPRAGGASAPESPAGQPPPSGAAPAPSQPGGEQHDARLEACVDEWLKAKGLNRFGDPADTMYAGGSPLFDESTGETTDRMDYVLRRHPHAKVACSPAGTEAPPP